MIPTGSVVGIGLIVFVVGVLIGRSSKAMGKIARTHAAAHGGSASAKTGEMRNDQRVQTVVVVDRDGVPRSADGRYDLDTVDAHVLDGQEHVVTGASERVELVEADADSLSIWDTDDAAAAHAYVVALEDDPR